MNRTQVPLYVFVQLDSFSFTSKNCALSNYNWLPILELLNELLVSAN